MPKELDTPFYVVPLIIIIVVSKWSEYLSINILIYYFV
jgi:hypothetical protein